MEIIAKSSVRVAPRKIRLVADAIRSLSVENALITLSMLNKRGAKPLEKTIKSAIANAKNNNDLKQDALNFKSIEVGEASAYKRYHPSTRGRIHPYKRRGSHIRVVLTDNKSEVLVTKSEINSRKINTQKQLEPGKEKNGTKS